MSRPTPRPVTVPPGPAGVTIVATALREAFGGLAPPLALLTDGGSGGKDRHHHAALAAALRIDAPIDRDGIAVVLATSGSTGEPHGVLISLSALIAASDLGAAAIGPPGIWLAAVPLTGIGGLLTVARSLRAGFEPLPLPSLGGAAVFRAEEFAAAAAAALAHAQSLGVPCYVSLVPTQLRRLVQAPQSLDVLAGFGAVLVGGAWVPDGDRAIAAASGVRIIETYGATETCGGVVYDGEPLPGVSVGFMDALAGGMTRQGPGRIVIQGPTLAAGYRLRPDATAAAFTAAGFRTSDYGRRTAGRIIAESRLDHMIKVGGVKVSLTAVTNALRTHPRVLDAVTTARPDAEWGDVPVAYLLTDESVGDEQALRQELAAIVTDRLGRASQPRRIEFVDHLPGHSGKPNLPAAL